MTIREICELIDKYDKCPKCGCETVVEIDTLNIKEGYFKCACPCGWSIDIKV